MLPNELEDFLVWNSPNERDIQSANRSFISATAST